MKHVQLPGFAVIAGAVRYSIEGPIPVDDAECQRLLEAGTITEDDILDDDIAEAENDGLDDEKVEDLKTLAELEGVDLDGATKKAAIIAAIRAHRNAAR